MYELSPLICIIFSYCNVHLETLIHSGDTNRAKSSFNASLYTYKNLKQKRFNYAVYNIFQLKSSLKNIRQTLGSCFTRTHG